MKLYATILAGGSGTRFWPMSRGDSPKQFLDLEGTGSLLQNTVKRITPLIPLTHVQIVTAAHLHTQTLAQLPELPAANVLSEPLGRNTAAAVGLAAMYLVVSDPAAMMAVLPADHVIPDGTVFCASLLQAAEVAEHHDVLMTLGIQPTYPATGYGYIKAGDLLPAPTAPLARRAAQFTEKPPLDVATRFVSSGQFFWNCGIFVWRATTILEEIRVHLPALWQGLETYFAALQRQDNADTLQEHYAQLPNISIDNGVLEKSSRVGVLPVTFAWNDVGSWGSLGELHQPDSQGNVAIGRHLNQDSTGLIVYSPDKLVATIGLTDLIIVQTDDVLLICPKDRDQEVRDLVNTLWQRGRTKYL